MVVVMPSGKAYWALRYVVRRQRAWDEDDRSVMSAGTKHEVYQCGEGTTCQSLALPKVRLSVSQLQTIP